MLHWLLVWQRLWGLKMGNKMVWLFITLLCPTLPFICFQAALCVVINIRQPENEFRQS